MKAAKKVTAQYYGGPWDGKSQVFETDQAIVQIPVFFDFEGGMTHTGVEHQYLRTTPTVLIYIGVVWI